MEHKNTPLRTPNGTPLCVSAWGFFRLGLVVGWFVGEVLYLTRAVDHLIERVPHNEIK